MVASQLITPFIKAADSIDLWTGTANANWNNTGSWKLSARPTASQIAEFNGNSLGLAGSPTYATTLNTNPCLADQVWFTNFTAAPFSLKVSGTDPLNLYGSSGTSPAGVGILYDSTNTQSITITAPITLEASQSWEIDGTGGTAGVSVSSVIGGSAALTKTGLGTLFLSGANTYSGTTLSAGTIQVGSAAALGAGSVTFSAASTLQAGANNLTLANNVGINGGITGALDTQTNKITLSGILADGTGGSGTLNKIGTGILVLTGSDTYSGGTSISAGTLQVGSAGTAGALPVSGTVSVAASSFLNFDRTDSVTFAAPINGAGTIQQIGSGTVTLSGAISGANALAQNSTGALIITGNTNTYTGGTTVSAGTLQIGANGTAGALTGNVSIAAAGTLAFNRSDNISFGGVISGSGALNQIGPGTLNLTGNAGTFSGIATVTGGTLALQPGALAATASVVVKDAAGLSLANSSVSALTLNNLTLGQSAGSTLTLSLTGTPAAVPFAVSGTLLANGTTALNIINTGPSFSTTAGPFPLISYLGGTLASGSYNSFSLVLPPRVVGNLVNDAANSSIDLNIKAVDTIYWAGAQDGNWNIGTIDASGNVLTGTPNWKTNSVGATTAYLQGTAPGDTVTFDDRATGNFNVNLTTILQPASVTVNNSLNNYTFSGSGQISGSTSLTKYGTASLTLNTANTYTGPTNLIGGTIILGAVNALPATTVLTFGGAGSNGTLDLGGSSQRLGGLGTATGAAPAGQVIGSSGAAAVTLTYAGGTSTFGGTIQDTLGSGSGTISLNVAGGSLALTGVNTFSGGTSIGLGATLTISGESALGAAPAGPMPGSLAFNGGTLATTASVALNSNRGIALGTGGGTLAPGAGTSLAYGGVIAGTGGLAINGVATVALSASNTYSGPTTISGATLNGFSGDGVLGTAPGSAQINWLNLSGATLNTTASFAINANRGITLSTTGATFSPAAGTTLTYAGIIGGSGGLTLGGPGTLALTGTSTYVGSNAVTAGTLSVSNDAALGNASNALSISGATLATTAGFTSTRSISIGAGGATFNLASGTNLNAVAVGGNVTVNGGTLTLTNTGTDSANIAGTGAIATTGNTVLSGTNSYSGGTVINSGSLTFSSAAAFPSTGAVTANGALIASVGYSSPSAWLNSGRLATTSTGALALVGTSFSDPFNAGGLGYNGLSLGAATGNTVTYTGAITPGTGGYLLGSGGGTILVPNANALTGSNALTVNNASAATVVLGGANSFTGAITIDNGTLKIGNPLSLGSGNALTLSATATLDLAGNNATVGVLNSSSGALITDSGPGASPNVFTFNDSAASTYTGAIKDGTQKIEVVKTGSGTLTINNGNQLTFTGGLFINGGTIQARDNNANALPPGGNVTFAASSTLQVANNGSGTAAATLTLGTVTASAGDAVIQSDDLAGITTNTQVLTLASAPTRLPGATLDFNFAGTNVSASKYTVKFAVLPPAGQSLDGGIFYTPPAGIVGFAAYDATNLLHALVYGTDANAPAPINLSSPQATLEGTGTLTGNDVEITGDGISGISAQDSISLRTLAIDSANPLTISPGATLTLTSGGLLKTGGNAATISGGTISAPADLVINTGSTADVLNVASLLFPSSGLTKTGPGVLTLTGSSSYSSGTFVNAGTLELGSSSTIASGSIAGGPIGTGPLILNGGVTLEDNGAPQTIANAVSLGGAITFASSTGSSSITIDGATGLTSPNGVTLINSVTATVTNTTTINSPVGDGGNGYSLSKAGSGTLILFGSNTYSGGTTVSAGTLRIGNAQALGTGGLTVGGTGALLDLNGFNVTVTSLTGSAGGVITDDSTGTGVSTLTANVPAAGSTFTGALLTGANGHSVGLVKTGPGSLVINDNTVAQNYTGGLTINQGELEARTNNADVFSTYSGETLTFTGTGIFVASNNSTTVANSTTLGAVAANAGDAAIQSNDYANNTTSSQTLNISGIPARSPGATLNFSLNGKGVTGGTAAGKYQVAFFSSAASIPGGTVGQSLNGGIYYGSNNFAAYDPANFLRALQYGTDANAVEVTLTGNSQTLSNPGTDVEVDGGNNYTLSVPTGTQTIRSLKINAADNIALADGNTNLVISGGGIIKAGGSFASISGPAGSTIGASSTDIVVNTVAATDSLTIATNIVGTGGLTKTGAGTLTITSGNTYGSATGAQTFINAGTALVNNPAGSGSATGSGGVNVLANATLGGSGTIGLGTGNSVSIASGATLSPGVPGAAGNTLTVTGGNVNLASNATLSLKTGGGIGDELAISNGNLNLASDNSDALVLTASAAGAFSLVSVTNGGISGVFATVSVNGINEPLQSVAGSTYSYPDLTLTYNDIGPNAIQVNVLDVPTVPEPSSLALPASGLLALLRRRRRAAIGSNGLYSAHIILGKQ